MKRRENNDLILRGWSAFFHRVAMFLLFPLRKPLIFFPIVLILFLAPTFRGVKPTEVHTWYWSKLKSCINSAVVLVQNATQKVLPENLEFTMTSLIGKDTQEKGTDKLVDYPVADVNANRKAIFERAQGGFLQPVDIVNEVDSEVVASDDTVSDDLTQKELLEDIPLMQSSQTELENLNVQDENTQNSKSEIKRDLPLVYLDVPKNVSGIAKVHNANELEVDGTYIFLYGIYVNPDTSKGIQAKEFLDNLVKNKTIRCSIVAYTFQDVATGMCYVDGENINQLLVNKNFSKNVAL